VKRLKLAVIGAGHLGKIHARLLAKMPDVELVGIADPLERARRQVAVDCNTRPFASHCELLPLVEAAIIATTTRHHHAVAMDFLRCGTPLLIEKPLAATLAEADELVAVARQHEALLQVGHVERFNPAFVAAAAHLSSPRLVEAVRAGGFSGRSTDIGVVLDLMIHDIDLVLSLVATQPHGVWASGRALLGRHEDLAEARLEFDGGCVANLSASRVNLNGPARRQMQIWSEGAFATIDFAERSVQLVRPCEAVVRGELDFESLREEEKANLSQRLPRDILPVEVLKIESANALADELRDFVDSIRAAKMPRVSGQQGRDALAVAERVLEAIHRRHQQIEVARGTGAGASFAKRRAPHWLEQPRPASRGAA
jgi:predicted dehydrogenase